MGKVTKDASDPRRRPIRPIICCQSVSDISALVPKCLGAELSWVSHFGTKSRRYRCYIGSLRDRPTQSTSASWMTGHM